MKFVYVLGKNLPYGIIISSILFSLLLFFYIMTIGSFFKPTIYPLLDRVTYSTPFIDKYFISKFYDQLIILIATSFWFLFALENKSKYLFFTVFGLASSFYVLYSQSFFFELLALFSLPLVLIFLLVNYIQKNSTLFRNKQLLINYISIFSIIIGFASLIISIFSILNPQINLPSVNYLYYIYLLFSTLSPILLLIIGLFIPIGVFIDKVLSKKNVILKATTISKPNNSFLKLRTRIIYMFVILFLSAIIIWIPHLPTVNEDNQIVGADTKDYVNFLISIGKPTTIEQFVNAFIIQLQGDRSLSLIAFYLFSQIRDPSNLTYSVELLPIILGPLLIITIYFLTMELTSNHITSILSSFITAISFPTLVGVYGGLYANWFSLVFVSLAMLFLVRSLNNGTKRNIVIFSVMMVVVLLTHEPSWPILSLIFLIFLIILLYLKPLLRKNILFLILGMAPSFIIEIIRMIFTKNSGVIKNISFAQDQGLGIHGFSVIWDNLVASTQTYLAGQFGNFIVFILVIYWLSFCNVKNKSNLLLITFLSIPIIPILFGDTVIISRVLYEIPFQIPAAVALTHLKKSIGNIFIFAVCLWLLVIAIRSVSNFYFNPL